MAHDRYESPFSARYASPEMQYIFSDDKKFKTWRKLWIALARSEAKLGLKVTQAQVEELEKFQDDINYDVAKAEEKRTRHDVMSHVYAYGVQCPLAKPIIHLGATSMYVDDNTDIIVMSEGLKLIRRKLVNVIVQLGKFAKEYKDLPTLAYTHFQPAQPTTVGKRATLWAQDLVMDLEQLDFQLAGLKLLGNKGATGTQASFLSLFGGDAEKVKELERLIAAEMGFSQVIKVSGQTYTRKVDSLVMNVLSGIAQSASKFAGDIRHLQNLKEVEEPFEKGQTGSSAMPYKRNPMRSERIGGLTQYVMVNELNAPMTVASQWLERTLNDSSNRRVSISEAFLATDGILDILLNVTDGLVVYPKVIAKHLAEELPFFVTENIMMWEVENAGGDRQVLHERIKEMSQEVGFKIKELGVGNDLLEMIDIDPTFTISSEEIAAITDPGKLVGLAPLQTQEFYDDVIQPIIDANVDILGEKAELFV